MTHFIRSIFWIILFLTGGSLIAQTEPQRIFPAPKSLVRSNGQYVIKELIRFKPDSTLRTVLPLITSFYQQQHGLFFVQSAQQPTDLTCSFSDKLKSESYTLTVNRNGIRINYADRIGLYYAMLSLDQWFGRQKGVINVDYVQIIDAPKFGYRGMHLDCSRHFFTVNEVKVMLDQMAQLKLNRFHWHLTDDQGWRLEIKRFPLLTEIGAWRDSTLIGHYGENPVRYDKTRTGGFYTQDDAREVIRYAAERGITVIPEIELPGHARAALAAYPELGCTGEKLPVAGTWGVFDDVFCSKDATMLFLEQVLDEVVDIFPSKTIHVGGDECPKVRWKSCPSCQKTMRHLGLKDEHALQSHIIRRMDTHLRKRGKQLMGWDEILEGGLADNAQVMSWRGTEGGIAAAKEKHEVVMTPTSHCYFDYYQSSHPDEPLAIGGFLPLEKVYNYEVVPKGLSNSEQSFILGSQANIWTEYLPTISAVQYHAFPRLIALSQVVWTENKPSYESFVQGLVSNYLWRLDTAKVTYSTSFIDPSVELTPIENGIKYDPKTALSGVELVCENEKGFVELKRTDKLIEHTSSCSVNYMGRNQRQLQLKYVEHAGIGLPVTFKTPPNEKFNVHGKYGLTDGVRGQLPWKGDQWLGFSTDTVEFVVDLPKSNQLHQFQLGFLNDPGSWIYRPYSIIVEASQDGVRYGLIKQLQIDSDHVRVALQPGLKKLRIRIINNEFIPDGLSGAGTVPWTFVDELILEE